MAKSKKSKSKSKNSQHNVSKCECSLCEIIIPKTEIKNLNRLLAKVNQFDIKNQNQFKNICDFECLVCNYNTNVFNDWKIHIISISHMRDAHKIKDILYSYVCTDKGCKLLLYGTEKSICEHKMKNHLKNCSIRVGIPVLMIEVMKRFITKQKPLFYCSHCKKFKETPIHSKDEKAMINPNKIPIEFYCNFCQVTFLSSVEMMDYHSLTVEHTTIKCYYELCINQKLLEQSNQMNENNLLPDDFGCSGFLNNVDKLAQEPIINNVKSKTKDDKDENGCKSNIELKTKYNIYFQHKMQKLNILRQFKNCTMEKISYYCKLCDFIDEDKNKYDKHTIQNVNHEEKRHSIFCSTCCMFIFGSDTKEHDNTTEHRILLKFLLSIKHIEEDLNSFNSSLSNEMCLNPLINNELELNNIDSIKGCQYENDKYNDNVTIKSVYNEITLLPTVGNQPKIEENMKIKLNYRDMSTSTDDLSSSYNPSIDLGKNEKRQKKIDCDENKAYGEYVVQRLQYITNNTVKQNIKLEIDYIFYKNIKQLSKENII